VGVSAREDECPEPLAPHQFAQRTNPLFYHRFSGFVNLRQIYEKKREMANRQLKMLIFFTSCSILLF